MNKLDELKAIVNKIKQANQENMDLCEEMRKQTNEFISEAKKMFAEIKNTEFKFESMIMPGIKIILDEDGLRILNITKDYAEELSVENIELYKMSNFVEKLSSSLQEILRQIEEKNKYLSGELQKIVETKKKYL
ncbi:MAG: hypothetical protein ACPLZ9_03985 [Candidatus Ratteibacteria bacterium]